MHDGYPRFRSECRGGRLTRNGPDAGRALPALARHLLVLIVPALTLACGGSALQVNHGTAGAYEAALAPFGDGLAVAWHDTRHERAEIYVRLLDSAGRPSSPEWRLTDDDEDSYEASIDAFGDALAVAWYGKAAGGGLTARLGVWERAGAERWVREVASPGRNPVVRADGDTIFAVWIQEDDAGSESVMAAWWDAGGTRLGEPAAVAPASATTWNLNATVADGVAWIAFDAEAGTERSELFLARVARDGVDLRRLSADDGYASAYPDIAIAGEVAALTWFDERDGNTEIYLLVAPLRELTPGIDHRATRVTATPGESIGAYVAWNGGRVGLAWSDDTGGQHEVYFQAFDRDGRASGRPQRITRTAAASLIPAIRPWRDGFALAWNEYHAPPAGGHPSSARSHVAFATVR